MVANTRSIPTFTETINNSDFPTAFAPTKLTAVKIRTTAVAKIFDQKLEAFAAKNVAAYPANALA